MQVPDQKIVVLGTGGTIAGRLRGDDAASGAYDAAREPVEALLHGLQVPRGYGLVAEQVAQVDSKDMDLAVWQTLVRRLQHWLSRADVAAVLVTHGTDTLEETAWLLQSLLAPARPVVLVSAMRAADAPDADGPANLRDALGVGVQPGARGVVAVAAGRILSAEQVQKVHGSRIDAFASACGQDLGEVREGAVSGPGGQPLAWPASEPVPGERVAAFLAAPALPRVWSGAGFDAGTWTRMLDPSCARLLGLRPLQGLVLVGTGSGTLHHGFEPVVQVARDAGVDLVLVTRCAQGGLAASASASSGPLAMLRRSTLSPVKARIQLMLDILGQASGVPA